MGWVGLQVTRAIVQHISGGGCDTCLSKAHICELCSDKTPIFPFQLQKVVQCKTCLQCFHRSCFDPNRCPKCARLAKRKAARAAAAAAAAAQAAAAPASPIIRKYPPSFGAKK